MRKDMNFFSQLKAKKKTTGDDKDTLLYVFAGIVAAFIVVTLVWNVGNLIVSGAQIKSYQNKLNDTEVQAKLAESDEVNLKLNNISNYDTQLTKILGAVSSREVVTTKLIEDIKNQIPKTVGYNNINVKSSEIVLSGVSATSTEVVQLQHNLRKISRIQDVFVDNISGEDGKITFNVKCTLKEGE